MRYVLDTNIVARLLVQDPRVAGRLDACESDDATLITNDSALKDGEIEGLKVEDWLEGT